MAQPSLAVGISLLLFAMFQLKFAVITPALITGSFAERIRFSSYLIFLCFFTLFVYCPLAHWAWHPQGFLRQMGVLDFAGGNHGSYFCWLDSALPALYFSVLV